MGRSKLQLELARRGYDRFSPFVRMFMLTRLQLERVLDVYIL